MLTILLWLTSFVLFGQDQPQKAKLVLSKIVFHSSRCNGLCPKLDFEIDSNNDIFVFREFYLTKSKIDKKNSGNFKGTVKNQDYQKLIAALDNLNLDTLEFPDVKCCDGIVSTIIIYFNGKRKYLKSMTPPQSAQRVIWILNNIGYDKELKRTTEIKNIED